MFASRRELLRIQSNPDIPELDQLLDRWRVASGIYRGTLGL
jgi:hypothetical protein